MGARMIPHECVRKDLRKLKILCLIWLCICMHICLLMVQSPNKPHALICLLSFYQNLKLKHPIFYAKIMSKVSYHIKNKKAILFKTFILYRDNIYSSLTFNLICEMCDAHMALKVFVYGIIYC